MISFIYTMRPISGNDMQHGNCQAFLSSLGINGDLALPLTTASNDQSFESTVGLPHDSTTTGRSTFAHGKHMIGSMDGSSLGVFTAGKSSNIEGRLTCSDATLVPQNYGTSIEPEKLYSSTLSSDLSSTFAGRIEKGDCEEITTMSIAVVDATEEMFLCTSGQAKCARKKSSRASDSNIEDKLLKKKSRKNEREKERSSRIAKQISDLRQLLAKGGFECARGTRRSILDEAICYIRSLQENQKTANCTGKVGSINSMAFDAMSPSASKQVIQSNLYELAFRSCDVGIAIASLGGDIIECNDTFASVTEFSKEEICSKTIFNFLAQQHLDTAFELVSQLIIHSSSETVIVSGISKNKEFVSLRISLSQRESGLASCFICTAHRAT